MGESAAEVILLDECPAEGSGVADDGVVDKEDRLGAFRHRHHRNMLWISAGVVVLSLLLVVQPGGRVAFCGLERYPLPESCMSHSLFGLDCPGCGLTRSFVYLAHGRWADALAVHRLGWLLAGALLLQFPYRIAGLRHRDGLPLGQRLPAAFGHLLIIALIANWLVNLIGRPPG